MNGLSLYLKTNSVKIGYVLFFIVTLIPFLASAQTRGTLEVIKDPLIDTLIARRPLLDKVNNIQGGETATGYRVQIYFGSNRQAAYNAQSKFNQEYPEYRTYITYSEPNFRVHAGDFRTHLEAEKLMKDIAPEFTSLFIISGKINPPKADND